MGLTGRKAAVLFFFSESRPIDSDFGESQTMPKTKRPKRKSKKGKGRLPAADCLEGLLVIHNLQAALLNKLAKCLRLKAKPADRFTTSN